MPEKKVLKGVYKDGTLVCSIVIVDAKAATIYCKGMEPAMPMDPNFIAVLKRVAEGTREHVAKCDEKTMFTLFEQRPTLMDQMAISPTEVEAMGVRFVGAMDAESGLTFARYLPEPLATPLAYTSLKASALGSSQPGRVDLPAKFKRLTWKELTQPARDVIGVAVQVAGEGLLRLVCLEDEGLKLLATVRDFPPARARAALYSLDALMDAVKAGKQPIDIANMLQALRGG
jgi:hypothetical protein